VQLLVGRQRGNRSANPGGSSAARNGTLDVTIDRPAGRLAAESAKRESDNGVAPSEFRLLSRLYGDFDAPGVVMDATQRIWTIWRMVASRLKRAECQQGVTS
jgi:hypothetical protein